MILGKCFLITTHLPGKFSEREAQFLPCFFTDVKIKAWRGIFLLPLPRWAPPSDMLPHFKCVFEAYLGRLNVNSALGAPELKGFLFPHLGPKLPQCNPPATQPHPQRDPDHLEKA